MADRQVVWELRLKTDGAKAQAESFSNSSSKAMSGVQKAVDAAFQAADKRLEASFRKAEKEINAHLKAIEKAEKERVRNIEQLQSKSAAANAAMLEGSKQAMSGVASLGRSVVLLGLAKDEDKKKWLEYWATLEAVFQGVKGGIEVYQGLAKAIQAANTAKAAGAALDALGGAGGAAKGVAGAAGSALGGAGAMKGAAGAIGLGPVGIGALIVGGIGLAAAEVAKMYMQSVADEAKKQADDKAKAFAKSFASRMSLQDEQGAMRTQDNDRARAAIDQQAKLDEFYGGGRDTKFSALESLVQKQMEDARGAGSDSGRAVADSKAAQDNLQEMARLRREEYQDAIKTKQERLSGIKEEIEETKRIGDLRKQQLADEENSRMSFEEKFARMSGRERAAFDKAVKADRAGTAGAKEIDLLRSTGYSNLNDGAGERRNRERFAQMARDAGVGQYSEYQQSNRRSSNLKSEIDSNAELRAQLEKNKAEVEKIIEQQGKAMKDEITKLGDAYREAIAIERRHQEELNSLANRNKTAAKAASDASKGA